MLGLYINSSINIYYHCERRSRYETSYRLFTSKYDETTISCSTETSYRSNSRKHHIQHINFYSDKQSGRKDNRSGYRQMTQLIQQGQCDILCCYRLNRLHRNLKNALKLIKLCQTYHVHILSVHDGYFDMDQAFDRLKLNIFISLAELESDNIGEQVRNGLQEKQQGRLITTHALWLRLSQRNIHHQSK